MPNIIPNKGDPDYTDYVIQLAKSGVMRKGVINEPRVYFDEIEQDDTNSIKRGDEGVFQNGEQFPVRLTHLIATTRFFNDDNVPLVDDELNVQRIGLRLKFHDQFYMNPEFLPVPVWGNKVTAMPPTTSFSTSHWDFVANGQPFVLSARDTLVVTVQLQNAPAQDEVVPVDMVITGIGMLSKRPYFLNGRRNVANVNPINLTTIDFRNDGTEPIAITDAAFVGGPESGAVDPQGDNRRWRFNVRQAGNGTNAQWFIGPQAPVAIPNMQADMFGITAGRCVVHQFPGDGMIWEPGEGVTIETQSIFPPDGFSSVLCVGLAGYIMVV